MVFDEELIKDQGQWYKVTTHIWWDNGFIMNQEMEKVYPAYDEAKKEVDKQSGTV